MTRTILTDGAPTLRVPSAELPAVTKKIRRLIDDMFETMYAANGIGLAAPQIGENVRVIVVDIQQGREQKIALVNPVITHVEGAIASEEGCLSCPGVTGIVPRAAQIRVEGLSREGEAVQIDAQGLLAICLQHEIDHLDGILFTDKLAAGAAGGIDTGG